MRMKGSVVTGPDPRLDSTITIRPLVTTHAHQSLLSRHITMAEVDEAVLLGRTTLVDNTDRAVISHKDLRLAVKRSGKTWYLITAMRTGDLKN